MKLYFTSYASHDAYGFFENQDKLANDAKTIGRVDEVIKWRDTNIQDFIRKVDSYISVIKPKYPRVHTAKYYIWKSYVILKTLERMSPGDVLIYHDAGRNCYPYKFTREFRTFCDYVIRNHRGLYVNFGPFSNSRFTKRDCFRVMECDSEFYWNSRQANGSWGVYQKTDYVERFVSEWFDYCMHDSMIVTDIKSKTQELKQYEAHRHDQSILTNMLLKYSQNMGLPLDPKQSGKLKRPWGWEKDMCLAMTRLLDAKI